jgi:AraC-like DNA-binding protein
MNASLIIQDVRGIAKSSVSYEQDRRRRLPSALSGPDFSFIAPTAQPSAKPRHGAFGRHMAEIFKLSVAPTLTTSILKRAQMAATRLTSGFSTSGVTSPIPAEKAYLLTLQLRQVEASALWIGGQAVHAGALAEGSISIIHLEDEPIYHFTGGFDCLQFYIPEIIFEELESSHRTPLISGLAFHADVVDRVIQQLGAALLPSLAAPGPAGRQFFDHIALALFAHLARAYGENGERPRFPAGGLTSSQEYKAKALLSADLIKEPCISEVAIACGLPPGRFVRAFRIATGMPPHRWLRQFRVERAKELLFGSRLSLAQIAYDCGFSDQSHFTRVFSTAVGKTPGAWRRLRRS